MSTRSSVHRSLVLASLLFFLPKIGQSQVSPTGGHHSASAQTHGIEGGLNAVGAFSLTIPLTLPESRSGLPLPLSIEYFGGARVGAAGVGWSIPLSYVRRSTSVSTRLPSQNALTSPERLSVVVAGASYTLTPTVDSGIYRPTIAPNRFELRMNANQGWTGYDDTGLQYTFEPLAALGDDGLWMLTRIAEGYPGGDEVRVSYNVLAGGCHAGRPELSLSRLEYSFADDAQTPLYSVDVAYTVPQVGVGWHEVCPPIGNQDNTAILSHTLIDGNHQSRSRLIDHVTIRARNNLDSTTSLRTIARYQLIYKDDPDLSVPRLAEVTVEGESGPAQPILELDYGSLSVNDSIEYVEVSAIPRAALNLDNTQEQYISYSETHTTTIPIGFPIFANISMDQTTIRQLLHDFTGDGLPDLSLYDPSGSSTIHRNATTPGQTAFSSSGVGSGLDVPTSFESSEIDESGITTNRKWIDTIDWNGDGRMDVVSAIHGKDRNHWKVFLNLPNPSSSDSSQLIWQEHDIFIDHLRSWLVHNGFEVAEFPTPSDKLLGHEVLPLARSKTAARTETEFCDRWEREVGGGGVLLGWEGPEQCAGFPKQAKGRVDTITEWQLQDVNGDAFVDFVSNSTPVRKIEPREGECLYQQVPACQDPTNLALPSDALTFQCNCSVRSGIELEDGNDVTVIHNTGGAFIPDTFFGSFSGQESPQVLLHEQPPLESCGVEWWQQGGDDTFEAGSTWRKCGFTDVNGDGIVDRQGRYGDGAGNFKFDAPRFSTRFENNRHEVCTPGADSSAQYETHQTAGLIDLNGDGSPDWVYLDQRNRWYVRFGTGAGWGAPKRIHGPFELSLTRGTCGGASGTVAGLFDTDGDGRPEIVVADGTRLQRYSLADSLRNPGALQAGRLRVVGNGAGAQTLVFYKNAKTDNRSPHQIPQPEVVVDRIYVSVPGRYSDPDTGVRFAYGDARLVFDPLSGTWRFPGYGRRVQLRGIGSLGVTTGWAVIESALPWPTADASFSELATVGSTATVDRLVGEFNSDPYVLINVDIEQDSRWRGRSLKQYSVLELPTSGSLSASIDERCSSAHPFSVNPSQADPVHCHREAIVRLKQDTYWTGTQPPDGFGTNNVFGRSQITKFDDLGRPIEIHHYGDLRSPRDDSCLHASYAEPTDAAHFAVDIIHAVRVDDCGARKDGQGLVKNLAGIRYEFDDLSGPSLQGKYKVGLPTKRILEQYNTSTGAKISEYTTHEFQYEANAGRGIKRITSTRLVGSPAQYVVDFTRDHFGLTVTKAVESGSDSDTALVHQVGISVWPSIPDSVTGPNGEEDLVYHDPLGRPVLHSIRIAGQEWAVESFHRRKGLLGPTMLTRRYTGFVRVDSDLASAPALRDTAVFDALGRLIYTKQSLGADYDDRTLVSGLTFRDGLGRVRFEAAPFAVDGDAEPPMSPVGLFGYTSVYDEDDRPVRTVQAVGYQPSLTATDLSAAELVSTYEYRYRDGELITRVRSPEQTRPEKQFSGAYTERRSDGTGFVTEVSHWVGLQKLDSVSFRRNPLGHRESISRDAEPNVPGGDENWVLERNSLGQVVTRREPGLSPIHFTYDEWGNVTKQVWTDDGRERVVASAFDAFGRLLVREMRADVGDGTALVEHRSAYFYDHHTGDSAQPISPLLGRMSSASTEGSLVLFAYDAFGGQRSAVYRTSGEDNFYRLDQDFAVEGYLEAIRFEAPGVDETVRYNRDSAGRPRAVVLSVAGAEQLLMSATHVDDVGRPREVKLGNGVTSVFEFDGTPFEREMGSSVRDQGNVFEKRYLQYDADGRLLRTFDAVGTDSPISSPGTMKFLDYDLLGRLRRVIGEQTVASDTTPPSALSDQISHSEFQYDSLGNVTKILHPLSEGVLSFKYSQTARDQLVLTQSEDGSTTIYDQDGAGNVVAAGDLRLEFDAASRVRRLADLGTTVDIQIQYGPLDQVSQVDVKSAVSSAVSHERRYGPLMRSISRPGQFEELPIRDIPGLAGLTISRRGRGDTERTIYQHGEASGNWLFTDSGKAIQRSTYAPYGYPESTGVPSTSPAYSSQLWNFGDELPVDGIQLLGSRVYDSRTGRFLQRDPIQHSGGGSRGNPYAFALNDPVNNVDPTGREAVGIGPCDELNPECVTAGETLIFGLAYALSGESLIGQRPSPSYPVQIDPTKPIDQILGAGLTPTNFERYRLAQNSVDEALIDPISGSITGYRRNGWLERVFDREGKILYESETGIPNSMWYDPIDIAAGSIAGKIVAAPMLGVIRSAGSSTGRNAGRGVVNWLVRHEATLERPTLGHTIAKHVGKDLAYLQGRLTGGLDAMKSAWASTFPDVATAQRGITAVFQRNRPEIQSWLRSTPIGETSGQFLSDFAAQPFGQGIHRTAQNTLVDLYRTKVILRKVGDKSYIIYTAHPIK